MKYAVLTQPQLLFMTIVGSVIVGGIVCCFSLFMDYRTLPVVNYDKTGACVSVQNYENGHAFNCTDVDVLLRRYRIVTPNEKISTPRM